MKERLRYLFIVGSLSLILSSCGSGDEYVRMEGMIWNTVYHITYKGPQNLQDSVLPVLNEVGQSLSVFDKNSIVSRLNDTCSLVVDSHFTKVYDESKRINRLSRGQFDPTVGPLIEAWGFGPGHTPTGDTLAIDSVRKFIGIEKTSRRGDMIIKEDWRTRFNFSAIAKGYGCDAVGEMMKKNGVSDYMVEIGGEISMSGKSPSGKYWRIAIDAPKEGSQPGEETMMVISLTDAGVATSGNYRNYREENGVKTAHTISPATGRPLIGEILSATIIAPTCMEADAIATACMAGPLKEAEELIEKAKVAGLLILSDSIWLSPSFGKYISK